ncbi:MAG: SpoIIE family protein phosphatase [Spirochaetaceae bacterium]|jgi:serine phosphatase RsbU (regulator of sigma subunit)|nr:SpoIIE family protein phosphatase [Spirochaetaceae bacterium]
MIRVPLRQLALLVLLGLSVPFLSALSVFYWEDAELFSPERGSFPASSSNGTTAIVAWQENLPSSGGGQIRISAAVKNGEDDWVIHRNIAGPYAYSGSEPSIISALVDRNGKIFIAAAADTARTELIVSEDFGETFSVHTIDSGSGAGELDGRENAASSSLAPRIYAMENGGYLLFITRGLSQSLTIYYARSEDGVAWTPFEPFINRSGLQLNFLPSHTSMAGREYVVFQSFQGTESPSFQIFIKSSSDGGRTWSESKLVTNFRDSPAAQTEVERYDNQRPHLSVQDNQLFMVWERRAGAEPQIYAVALDGSGNATGFPEMVNRSTGYCNNPIALSYEGEVTIVWFDNRTGQNRVYLAQRTGLDWENIELSGSGAASFGRPVLSGSDLFLFWQSPRQGRDRILMLRPDISVEVPVLRAQNFQSGRPLRSEAARIAWSNPRDSSGIQGYSYSWSMDPEAVPPRRISLYFGQPTQIEQRANEDGSWYFSLMVQDYAGNWSRPVSIEFVRDMTPPPPLEILPPVLDSEGYLVSNTFDMRWNPSSVSDLAGYTWSLEYLGPEERFGVMDTPLFTDAFAEGKTEAAGVAIGVPRTSPRVMGRNSVVSYANQDDGVWRFSVSAIDGAGNINAPSSVVFRTNKYIPHTFITYVNAEQNDLGILSLSIIGRGFAESGELTHIFLDRDGEAPYDREFSLSGGEFQVLSDREVGGISADDLDEGMYRIGLTHPTRGLYVTRPLVRVDEMGTIKFGDYSESWKPSWYLRDERRFVVDTSVLILAGIILFCIIGIFTSIRGIGSVVAEGAAIRVEAAALITGDIMPSERKKRMKRVQKRGIGLRFKLASFTVALVLLVVILVSAPLYFMMTRTQEETLLRGLRDRAAVLLEGLASSARAYLPAGNILELSFLPAQTAAIPEAKYVTITGYGDEAATFNDYVWATNDPEISGKIDTAELDPGSSRLDDALSPRLEAVSRELDERARTAVGSLSESITSLTQEALGLIGRRDAQSVQRMNDIQILTRSLETRLNEELAEIGRTIGSEPAFSTERHTEGQSTYIFFKPILYRQSSDDIYYRGLVRLEVSVDSIIDSIQQGQISLLRLIALVAASAIAIGTMGALVLAALIVQPIRKLVSHVEKIRDTEDKAKLDGVEIAIKTRDELAVLGTTINDMTHGLVKAAQAASDLTIGKEVQKKFIPLETDKDGNKVTSGYRDTKNAAFFGYYEGAKGVSGDYFDYQDLDGRYFAIIKCDVAGKGIPAALIMIQVATMFLNHFKSWKPTEKGMHIEEVVYQINDFIETLGFKGRFAAFTLCILDSQTGIIRFCNAGDNIVHWYDASDRRIKTITLPETPATGVLPNFLVESKGGYQVQTLTIDTGDILLLYTDGIEEAKRRFRDAEFKEIICTEGPNDTPHENHVAGQGDEEMGPDRVEAIVNAVMNRETYTLHKWHNPEGNIDLRFDFSDCTGHVEEVIMAMVSVEKMFRIYKDPKADENSRVLVDKKVDEFLKKHFLQYRTYCSDVRENTENPAYMYYTHVMEDAQYDDLTILGIKRK